MLINILDRSVFVVFRAKEIKTKLGTLLQKPENSIDLIIPYQEKPEKKPEKLQKWVPLGLTLLVFFSFFSIFLSLTHPHSFSDDNSRSACVFHTQRAALKKHITFEVPNGRSKPVKPCFLLFENSPDSVKCVKSHSKMEINILSWLVWCFSRIHWF